MHFLSCSPLLVLLFSLFHTTILASPISSLFGLSARQNGNIDTATACAMYSMIANYSTIGANATYRSAYLAASPEGNDPATVPLDTSIPKLPALRKDKALNAACGNLSTIALVEAEKNFTKGIVGQFTIKKVNGASRAAGEGALGTAVLVAVMVGAGLLL